MSPTSYRTAPPRDEVEQTIRLANREHNRRPGPNQNLSDKRRTARDDDAMSLEFLGHIATESRRFVEAIQAADPDAPVPSCPDWNVADLLWHLGEVQHFWAAIVGGPMLEPDTYEEPVRPDSIPGLHDFFQRSHTDLYNALDSTADDVAAWSWFAADQTVGFTRRRQAHEALVHRYDAELASGDISATDSTLATDGILEALELMFGGPPGWADVTEGGPIGRLRTNDTGADWLVQINRWAGASPNTGTTYTDEPVLAIVGAGEATFDISGDAAALHRWIWNRGSTDAIKIMGNTADFEAVIRVGVD